MEQENVLTPDEQENISATSENQAEEISEFQEIKATEKDIPDIVFTALSTADIVKNAQELLNNYPIHAIRAIIEGLPEIFDIRYKEEYEEALAKFREAGNAPEDFKYPHDIKDKFNSLYKNYKDKKNSANKKIEAEREENLKVKLQIIDELKELVQKEEALDKTFQEFRALQERWRNAGMVPQQRVNDLLETYHLHVENFYSYIKINKELRDIDLKRNQDAKELLCEEAEKLSENNDIANAFKQLQLLHVRWKEIGPIPKEVQEKVWERFKAATTKINDEYHNFFENLKKEQENNLLIKEEICNKAAGIGEKEYNGVAEWNNATKAILDLQEEWKHSGTIPQKERNRVYKKFRTACDIFFEKKRTFYKQLSEGQDKNLELKIKLCEKVEAIKDSTEWKTTTDKIISYQKEWKLIGPAPKKFSNKVWARFRAACDMFFNNKAEFFKTVDSEQEKNLELKKALVEELKQFSLSENNDENIHKLKSFQSRWTEIGHVPFKEKEAIQEEFRSILNGHFDKMSLDEYDKNIERFRTRMGTMDNGDHKDFKIVQEREKLVSKIRQLETDINTWENNIGFISKSKNAETIIQDLNSKIESTKQRLAMLVEKLKIIDNMI